MVPAGLKVALTASVWPRRGIPAITARPVMTGAPDVTGPTSVEVAPATPNGLVATTVLRSSALMSEAPGT